VRTALITGGAGFVATNTALALLESGHRVRVLDDLSRAGVEENLRWLEQAGGDQLEAVIGDVRDERTVASALRGVDSVFHFAAQVAVTTSLHDPLMDATRNVLGTLNLLEHARHRPRPPAIVFTSTNKVYGTLGDVELREFDGRWAPTDARLRTRGISEQRPLSFCTPYGCSKGAADQYVSDWASSFSVPTVVFRMSCIYGPHQFGTEDQGWVAHFLICALADEPITIYGDGKQVRDILFVSDLVRALLLAREHAPRLAGWAFNIGGGPANSVSLREVVALTGALCDRPPSLTYGDWRPGDQRWYVSDTSAFRRAVGWSPQAAPREGLAALRDWLISERATVQTTTG
jgi:CDP-paratose 2-epimerase